MPDKVLVVDDEPALRETVEYNLLRQGYAVVTASDGVAAVEAARRERPDLIILDLMLPGMDGLEVCRVLRREMNVPILMLTARAEEVDRVVGLEIGADDYVIKPFAMRELMARVKALLRRVRLMRDEASAQAAAPPTDRLTVGDLTIDTAQRVAYRGGQPLALKPREYELLVYLVRHRRMALSREQLLQDVWGWDYAGGSRTVDVHVRWLREKIEDDPARPCRITTVRGVGYRLDD